MRCINARTASPADGLGLGLGLGLGVAHRLTSALFWSSRNLKRIVFVLSCGRGGQQTTVTDTACAAGVPGLEAESTPHLSAGRAGVSTVRVWGPTSKCPPPNDRRGWVARH